MQTYFSPANTFSNIVQRNAYLLFDSLKKKKNSNKH